MWDRTLDVNEVQSIYNGGLAGLNVQGVVGQTTLSVEVVTNTGEIRIKGGTLAQVIDSYEITSAGNSLSAADWSANNFASRSLDAINGGDDPGETWEPLDASDGHLWEAFFLGTSTFGENRTESIGQAYDTTVDAQDLVFQFTVESGQSFTVVPDYIVETQNGDFDSDGDIDGADFLAWQQGFGSSGATLSEGDANGDGEVNAADFAGWSSQYGTTTGSLSSSTVPEPTSFLLLVFGFLGFLAIRRVS